MEINRKKTFKELILNPVKFRLFLLNKIPMAFLAGLRVIEFSEERAIVTVPYKFLTQNPFKSIYFACLAMAGELSTGVLAMLNTYKSNPPVSLLVIGMEAVFIKKATGRIRFECKQGLEFRKAVHHLESCDSQSLDAPPPTVRPPSLESPLGRSSFRHREEKHPS